MLILRSWVLRASKMKTWWFKLQFFNRLFLLCFEITLQFFLNSLVCDHQGSFTVPFNVFIFSALRAKSPVICSKMLVDYSLILHLCHYTLSEEQTYRSDLNCDVFLKTLKARINIPLKTGKNNVHFIFKSAQDARCTTFAIEFCIV